MSVRVSRLVLSVIAAIIIVTPLMPRTALSHESASIDYTINALAFYADEQVPGEATLDAELYALLEFIISLDDQQISLFQQALTLADDREGLAAFLLENGSALAGLVQAMPAHAGLKSPSGGTQEPLTEEERELLDHCGDFALTSSWWDCFLGHIVVDPIMGVINGISSTVDTIVTKADQIINDIGQFLQDVADKITEFGQDVMDFFRDVSDVAFGWIGEIKARYEAWVGNNCDGSSPCGQFRAHVSTFFGDIVDVEQAIAAMIGPVAIRLPGVPEDQISQAMAGIPHFLLWPLAEVLDLLPVNWWEIPSRVGALLPDVGPNAKSVWEIINDAENSGQPFDLCSHFATDGSGEISPLPHSNVDVYAMTLFTTGLGIIESYIPDDLTIDVLGEGTTVMAHPLKMVFTPIKQFVDLVAGAMGQVNDIDATCAAEAYRQAVLDSLGVIDTKIEDLGGSQLSDFIEDHLSNCTVIVSLYLPEANGGRLETVRDTVDGFINQVEAAGLSSNGARTLFDQGIADMTNGEYRRAYLDFCSSYRLLRYGEEVGAQYQGTGEVWACVSRINGAMRQVHRSPGLQPGDPGYYEPPVDQCSRYETLVEVYGYQIANAR